MRETAILARKELRDAARSRWLVAFAIAFALIALLLSGIQGTGDDLGSQGFNRTTASLLNLCLLLVPLLALILGAGAIAGERERGTLATLLAQPISSTQLLLGKYAGLNLAVWLAIALGFGGAGLLMALVEPLTDVQHYALFVVLSAALASASLSIGFLISIASESRLKAMAWAVIAWFGLVLVYDLAAVGFALSISSSGRTLLFAILLNPVECVRILAVMSLERDLEILGPLGAYIVNEVGTTASVLLLVGAIGAWIALPVAASFQLFRRQDV